MRVERLTVAALWKTYAKAASVSKALFNEYLTGKKHAFAIVVGSPRRFKSPIEIDQLKRDFQLRPPQSYCFLDTKLAAQIHYAAHQTTDRHKYFNCS
jgi:predicted transcriptional regulator